MRKKEMEKETEKETEKKMEVPDNVRFHQWYFNKSRVIVKLTYLPDDGGCYWRFLGEKGREYLSASKTLSRLIGCRAGDVTEDFKDFLKVN